MTPPGTGASHLSTPPRSISAPRTLTAVERETVLRIADTLIPGTSGDPPASQAPNFEAWLDRAIAARAESFDRLVEAIQAVESTQDVDLWRALKAMSSGQPDLFHVLSSIVAGAYLMVPEVMARIGYPGQRRNPASVDEALDQLGDGILDPVIDRGRFFRGTT